ncbi:MAG: hypothetical protein J0H79_13955 [Alphaproteobacteria bacterium]|nr:hypothetical protein [Alphaproteobacteria bacterium]
MLKLKTSSAEPFWLEILPGQKTQFKPVTMAMILVARESAARTMIDMMPTFDGEPIPDALADAAGRVRFCVTLAQHGIVDWEGVGDENGDKIAATPDVIAEYMANWRVFDAVQKLYVEPALEELAEKNVSAPLQRGTSRAKTAARTIAKRARRAAKNARTS